MDTTYLNQEYCKQFGITYQVNETPSHRFLTLFLNKNNAKIEMTIRDYSKEMEEGLFELITFVNENEVIQGVYNKVSDIDFKRLPFNALIIYQNQFEYPNEIDMNKYTIFPIYECEFTGNENPNEFFYLRRNIVNTIDWKREKTPIVRMKFKNLSTGVQSLGNNFQYFTEKDFYLQLKSLRKTGSYIEVKNYNNDHLKISIHRRKILLKVNHGISTEMSRERIMEFVTNFWG